MDSVSQLEGLHSDLLQAKHHDGDLLKRFGIWLRQQREQMKLTTTELARRVGVSQVLITRVERGNAVLSEDKLAKIFDELQVQLSFWVHFIESGEDPSLQEQSHILHSQLQTGRICCSALLNEFGWHIRYFRYQRHWTETELAARVGVTKQTICGVEQGKMVPSATLISHLAVALDMSLTDWGASPSAPDTAGQDLFWQAMRRLWGTLSDSDKMLALQIVERLSNASEFVAPRRDTWEGENGGLLGLDP